MSKKLTPQEIDQANAALADKTPQEILAWAIKTFSPGVGLSSSFGGESAGLIHMAIQIDPTIPVLFLDTGFLFKETHAFKDALQKQFHLNIRTFKASPAQIEQTKKNLLTKAQTGLCCDDAKIDLMTQSLKGLTCWIAGLRRNQSSTRKNIKIVENYADGLVKVHPLANWTSKEIYGYMKQHNLPFHPLWEKGFRSIGCEPCTQPPLPGQDDRSGRWAGLEKTECGIHTYHNPKKE
jgi:phosphoadenosine phosphosulfate reductase